MVIADVPATPGDGINGVRFGIDYNNARGQGLDIFGSRICTDGFTFPMEGPNGDWPAAGSGNTITWYTCQSNERPPDGVHAVIGSFYVYAYASDHFRIIEPPAPQPLRMSVVSCSGASAELPSTAGGVVAFVVPTSIDPGYNPCGSTTPLCAVTDRFISFGGVPLGTSRDVPITIRNESYYEPQPISGTVVLDCPDFSIVSGGNYTLPGPGDSSVVVVRVTPTATGAMSCVVHLGETCGDVQLDGIGVMSAEASLDPTSLFQHLDNLKAITRSFQITNTGTDPLVWDTHVELGTLEEIQAAYVAAQVAIRNQIPNRYNFNGGTTGSSIDLLGGGPYISGNKLTTNLGGYFPYTNGKIMGSAFAGPGGRYFTRKDLGIFLFAGDFVGVDQFAVHGYFVAPMGNDAVHQMTVHWQDVPYQVIVHRFYGNQNYPSVNHMFILSDPTVGVAHPGGRDENATLSGTGNTTRLFYLLYMGAWGASIDSTAAWSIANTFLTAIHPYPQWMHSASAGSMPGQSSGPGDVVLSAAGLIAGTHRGRLDIRTNSTTRPTVSLPITLEVAHVPDIDIAPLSIDFDSLYLDETGEETLQVANTGLLPLTVTAAVSDSNVFGAAPSQLILPEGQGSSLLVAFHPASLGSVTGSLSLKSNDPDEDSLTVPLRAVVLERPEISAVPPVLVGAAPPGGYKSKFLEIRNAGPTRLVFYVGSSEPWLVVTPSSGSVPAGQKLVLNVLMDAALLDESDYQGMIDIHSNATERLVQVPVTLHVREESVTIDVDPNTLNPASHGQFVHFYVELPSGDTPDEIVVETVLAQNTVPCQGIDIGDRDADGIPDVSFRFERSAFTRSLPPQDRVEATLTGEIRDRHCFAGRDSVRVLRPHLVRPNGGEHLIAGAYYSVLWEQNEVDDVDSVVVMYSADAGTSWTLAGSMSGGTRFSWPIPQEPGNTCLISVYGYRDGILLGYDVSDGPFQIMGGTTGAGGDPRPGTPFLFQNSPNPFSSGTQIVFGLEEPGHATIEVFDVSGRRVRTLARGETAEGTHVVGWDGRDDTGRRLAPGLYVVRLRAASMEMSRRMFLVP